MKSLLAWLVRSRRRFVAATSAIALAGSARLGRRKHGCVGALLGSRLVTSACSVVLCGAAGASLSFGAAQDPGNVPCAHARLSRSYIGALNSALSARTDVWGNQLLSSRNGPSYDSAARYLKPLFLAGHMPGRPSRLLTNSGAYYLPFAIPTGPVGAGAIALHVADGSEIISSHVGGPHIILAVGKDGDERYGSCRSRLGTPALDDGYLPILETRYTDAAGVSYRQESFAARIEGTGPLVSFVRLTADLGNAGARKSVVRMLTSASHLHRAGDGLVRDGKTYLWFSAGGRYDGSSLSYVLQSTSGHHKTIYLAWLDQPSSSSGLTLDAATYARVRGQLIDYWRRRLAQGTPFVVPERRVLDAERNLLIQNLVMGWRYSVGNPYQEFEYPETLDAASVLAEYGYRDLDRAILETALAQPLRLYPNWEIGAKLAASATHYLLARDSSYIAKATPFFHGYLNQLAHELADNGKGLLNRERWASDLPEVGYAFDSQSIVWQGLAEMAVVWSETGHGALARQASTLADRLGDALRTAVRASAEWLPDKSLFIPIELYAHKRPFHAVTESIDGSYWNITIPYALASGVLTPRGREANAALRYMLGHGSFFLGQIRAGGYSLSPSARESTSGTDDVYMLDLARFLADQEQSDRLVLSLYGQLADGMTSGTFVSGETASIIPLPGRVDREMYLPPNSVSNAAFLETLRLTLVHERADRHRIPAGLELAFSTPRAWLQPGRTIQVRAAPTSFGPISYTIRAHRRSANVSLDVPGRMPRTLRLRLRLPNDRPLRAVTLNGSQYDRFDATTETIDLSGHTGTLTLTARY